MSDDGPDPDAWLVTFGDLITLMLTFFVLMLSMSSMEQSKIEEAFEHFGGKPFVLKGGQSSVIGLKEESQKSMSTQIQSGMELARLVRKVLQSDEGGDVSPGENVLDATGEVRIKGDKDGQTIVFSGSFLFEEGSAVLKVGAMPVLDGIVKVLEVGDEHVSVEGHTNDTEIPLDPAHEDRWDLSAARAVNILKYLNQKGKIKSKRLSAAGYGESRPVKPNKTALDRRGNRRVEIVIANKTGPESR